MSAPVDEIAAARTLLSLTDIRGGWCLHYVWRSYAAHGAETSRSAPTATDAWYRSEGRHPGDRNPPPGVPVFWGPKASSQAGDVVISLGGGRVAATDWPRYGVTGVCTIDERERQIGRPYLGWAECIFDQPIALSPLADAGSTPERRFLMALNDDEQRELLTGIRGLLSSKDQADMFNNVSTIRKRVDGDLSSLDQVLLFQNVQAIRDRLEGRPTTLTDDQAAMLVQSVTSALQTSLEADREKTVAALRETLPADTIAELKAAL